MSIQTWTRQDWEAELTYIRSVDVFNPGKSFNHDTQCFKRYCQMQAKFAVNHKQPDIATEIRRVLADARLI